MLYETNINQNYIIHIQKHYIRIQISNRADYHCGRKIAALIYLYGF